MWMVLEIIRTFLEVASGSSVWGDPLDCLEWIILKEKTVIKVALDVPCVTLEPDTTFDVY
jgi:hypothetical protein